MKTNMYAFRPTYFCMSLRLVLWPLSKLLYLQLIFLILQIWIFRVLRGIPHNEKFRQPYDNFGEKMVILFGWYNNFSLRGWQRW
jgi:hypothetical protein